MFECTFKNQVCKREAHVLANLRYDCVEGEEIINNSVPPNVKQRSNESPRVQKKISIYDFVYLYIEILV